jgi:hypothetical protein
MAIQTLTDFGQIEKNINTQRAVVAANVALVAAQTELTSAQADRLALTALIDQYTQKNNQLRAQLAAIPTPGDSSQVAADLGTNTAKMRGAQSKYGDNQRRIDLAQRALTRAQAEVTRAAAADSQAAAQLAWAIKDDTDNDTSRQAVKLPPLSTIAAAATALLGDANGDYQKADAKLKGDVPLSLLQRAEARGQEVRNQPKVAADRVAKVQEIADTTLKTQTTSELAMRRTAYRKAQNDLRDYATNAVVLYQRALALLAPIPAAPGLTQDEKTAVGNLGGPSQPRTDALTAESDLGSALVALDAAQWALEEAELNALMADPDAPLPQTDAAYTAVSTARQGVTDKQGAFTDAMQTTLAQWEVAVPAPTWQLVADFVEADGILKSLKDVDLGEQSVTGLPKLLTDAELAYAAALEGDAKERRSNQIAQNAISNFTDQAAAIGTAAPAAQLSAVRGDG